MRTAPTRGETADGSKNGPEQGTEVLRLQPAPRYCPDVSGGGEPRFVDCFFREISLIHWASKKAQNTAESGSEAGLPQGFTGIAWHRPDDQNLSNVRRESMPTVRVEETQASSLFFSHRHFFPNFSKLLDGYTAMKRMACNRRLVEF